MEMVTVSGINSLIGAYDVMRQVNPSAKIDGAE